MSHLCTSVAILRQYSCLTMVGALFAPPPGRLAASPVRASRVNMAASRPHRFALRASSWPLRGLTGSRFARQHGRFAARRVARAPHKSLLLGLSEAKTFKNLLTVRPIGRGGRGLVLGSVLLDKDASEKLKSKTESLPPYPLNPKPKYTSPACCGSSTPPR